MRRKLWAVVGLAVVLLAGCAHGRIQASYERLCLAEGKDRAYCEAWSEVQAHKLMTERLGKTSTGVVLVPQF